MTSIEIKALAKQLGWEEYDYFGPVEHGEFTPPKYLILRANTILGANVCIQKIEMNGFKLYAIGIIDFNETEITGKQLILK